jgi:HAD superfamily hydrolase (TIGR01484 family)
MKKKYKALILDLDGTTIPNDLHGKPSQKVKKAIEKARKKIHVGIATSRPYFKLHRLDKELRLSGPSIIHNGSQIIEVNTGKIYQEYKVSKDDIKAIYQTAKRMNIQLLIDKDNDAVPATEGNTNHEWLSAVVFGLRDKKIADEFCDALAFLPNISTHTMVSWEKGCFDVSINHAKATKQHAIFEVAKILGIETHEMIGVGDGYNDFPLLMACGLKIAMGNAVDGLKVIADYIAPSVDEDGVVDVIEKFVL